MLKKIDHVGIAVRSLEAALPFYREAMGLRLQGIETVEGYLVRIAFLEIGESKIELLEPTSAESFLCPFLDRHGDGMHHVAYQVEDIVAAIRLMKQKGVRMRDEEPRPGAHGALVAFLDPGSSHFVLTELCQTKGPKR